MAKKSQAASLSPPKLHCYRIHAGAPALEPASSTRLWMDRTSKRFAYRCTPMVIANATGWEVLCPFDLEAEWTGEVTPDAIEIRADVPEARLRSVACSHFGHGILTFHPGYVFRTSPGWGLWARGTPNVYKDGLTPLEGLVETDWLPFSFTMNWRFTRAGIIRFQAGEPFCFLTLAPHGFIDEIAPTLLELDQDPNASADHQNWLKSRQTFNSALKDPNSEESKRGWQRRYLQALDRPEGAFHITRRKLSRPVRASDLDKT